MGSPRCVPKSAAAFRTRSATPGSASATQASATRTSASSSGVDGSSGSSALIIAAQAATSLAIGPAVSKDGASGQQPSMGDEAVRGLEADDAAAGRRDPDRPCGVGAERGVAEARGESRGRASARSARVAVRREWIADVAEVLVLGGDPVGELVQVGLPDDRVAPGLEARDGGCRPRGDVLGEDRRPVGRPEAGRVEEVLDAEADPVPWLLDLRDEGVQARLSRRRARSRRR